MPRLAIKSAGPNISASSRGEAAAIACTLGGPENRTLFMLTSTDAYPKRLVGTQLSRVDTVIVDTPGAGLP